MKRVMVFFIVVVQFAFMVFFSSQKDFFDGDEMFSYSLSNGHYTPFLRWNGDWWNQWHDVDYLTDQITVSENEAFDYGSVVYNQTQDVHPPVFYFILHTICSIDQEHFSKWQGICINLICYVLSLLLIYRIGSIMLNDEFLAVIPMLAYGLSAGAVTTVIYIRMYMLTTVLCLLDAYLHILLLCKYKYRNRVLAIVFLTTVVGGLTHYYFFIIAFISSVIYSVINFFESRRVDIHYGITRIVSVIVSLLIFPSAVTQATTGSRGISNISSVLGNLSDVGRLNEQICYYISYIDRQLCAGIGLQTEIVLIILLIVVLLITYRRKLIILQSVPGGGNKKCLFLCCLSVLYFFFVVNYAPKTGKGFRYITNIYPMIVLCLFGVFVRLIRRIVKQEYMKSTLFVFSIAIVCVSILSNKTENIEYLHSSNVRVVNDLKQYNSSAHFFINKSDSQEYSFWMQYQNMSKKKDQKFLVTTYNRILEMEDKDLNQIILEEYDNGILLYIITSYNQQEAEDIVDEIIGRTQLEEKDYIGTVDGERIFYCSR